MSEQKFTLPITGMTCTNCAANIERGAERGEVMIGRDGKRIEITPYDWIYVKDGLPDIPEGTTPLRACYVCFKDGKTSKAIYTGSLTETWVSQDESHITLNENEIVAWRYQARA